MRARDLRAWRAAAEKLLLELHERRLKDLERRMDSTHDRVGYLEVTQAVRRLRVLERRVNQEPKNRAARYVRHVHYERRVQVLEERLEKLEQAAQRREAAQRR